MLVRGQAEAGLETVAQHETGRGDAKQLQAHVAGPHPGDIGFVDVSDERLLQHEANARSTVLAAKGIGEVETVACATLDGVRR
ncbi:hypothetical protein GCM10027262_53320 [Nocardia tengchongensis]